ncbi:MAG: hypothetical protein ABS944_04145 [Solibacillus sp.]|jgi:hypothetical protein|uniref:hypothetical protein n=1 Tax=unclassified Solibacillus TaxID=2637870 RepID=UPI0030F7B403
MDNYTPKELNDITDMKQRVMQNVVQEIEINKQTRKTRWGIIMLTTVLTVSAMFFLFNQLFISEQHSATNGTNDFTQPLFEDKQGRFYLHGITLGVTKSTVVERLGEKYTTDYEEDGSGADYALDYNGDARFYFYEDRLIRILFLNTYEDAFEKTYKDYNGMKFTAYGQRYLYSNETSHIIKAELTPMETLHVSLSFANPVQLLENEGYLKLIEDDTD